MNLRTVCVVGAGLQLLSECAMLSISAPSSETT